MRFSSQKDKIVISNEMADIRLDKLLAERFVHHSRTYFQYLIKKNCILVNGMPIKKKERLVAGDEVDIQFEALPEVLLQAEKIFLEILYEDEEIIAINKPSGMVTHPAPGHHSGTVVHALLHHCRTLSSGSAVCRPGIVHRLDKETSGILLAAKTTQAHQKLVEMFSRRELEKTYLAVCIGSFEGNGSIVEPIKRHPIRRKEMAIDVEGKPATSLFKVIDSDGIFSFIEVRPITGRTHQIRVHLKYKGFPVLGDSVYGFSSWNKKYGASRQMLHAHRLKFNHPITGAAMNLEAPLPEDFHKLLLNRFPTFHSFRGSSSVVRAADS